ncbi:MAG: rhomboid family intramembrane serine protease [Chitinophagales bacterium]
MRQGFGGFQLTPAVKNLLIINGLMYLATVSLVNVDFNRLFALHPWFASDFYPHQFITHIFMHGSTMHLFMNMFTLWMFGTMLEQVWGTKRFLIYYMLTGIGAALMYYGVDYWEIKNTYIPFDNAIANPTVENIRAFVNYAHGLDGMQQYLDFDMMDAYRSFRESYTNIMQNPDGANTISLQAAGVFAAKVKASFANFHTMLGASGAVFGILLAFGMTFPDMKIMLLIPPIPMKAKYLVALFAVFELYRGMANAPDDNIAHFAHLGGMVVGFFILRYWRSMGVGGK